MLAELFAGTRETLILLPKKAGKSTLLGALALFHLCTTPDAECVIAAASRDQAAIMLRQAQGFIRRSTWLQERLHVKQREIAHVRWGGRVRILASDVDTADGVIPTLALVDELHRHKSSDLYGIFRDGLGPRHGQMITISTAGDDHESPLGQLRAAAYALPGMKRDGAHRWVASESFAMHEWALDSDEDRADVKVVKRANPASWQTVEVLEERRTSPSMRPWQWARFACGIWEAGEQGVISEKEWRACEDTAADIPESTIGVVIGVDLGWKWDTTAIVPVHADGESFVVGRPVIVTPPRDGTATAEHRIFDPICEMAQSWPEATVVIDPEAGGEQLAQRLEAEGIRVVTHSQKPSPMALAAQRLSEAISAKRLTHPGEPELTRHVLAATARPVGEGWRFVKPKKSGLYIDAAIALAMAVSVAQAESVVGGFSW